MAVTTAAARYSQLETQRLPFLDRARDAAKLTIPSLLPPDGHNGYRKLPTPYQGLGARGVNNLASKLLLALFPPNAPFFRYLIDDFALQKLTGRPGMKAEVDKALGMMERAVMTEIEATAMRVSAFEALKQLIVAGNVLCYLPPEGGMKVFRLDHYVVHRDPMGNVLEIITKETVAPDTLPQKYLQRLSGDLKTKVQSAASSDKTLDLYTRIVLKVRHWVVHQEVMGIKVPGTTGTYPADKNRYVPLRMTKIDGESYGRGHVEEYYGDLQSLEVLTRAIVEGSAAAAKVLILVNPNGTTNKKVIAQAPTGSVRSGNAGDVTMLQLDKYADFRIAKETIAEIGQRLSFAFLLNTAIQRGGERVTAEEIRYMAAELEDTLGGVYSVLSQEFQLPIVNRTMANLEARGSMPTLPRGTVRPTITTGIEALGRGHDLNKLDLLLSRLEPLGQDVLRTYLNVGDYITRAGTALGISMDGLVRTEEEVQNERKAQMAQSMLQQATPGMIDIARDQLKPQATPSNG